MKKCDPKYEYLGDGHVVCRAECKFSIKQLFVNERTKEQQEFTGCPELLSLFYLREMWFRLMGMQQLTEQTRNLTMASLSKDVLEKIEDRATKQLLDDRR